MENTELESTEREREGRELRAADVDMSGDTEEEDIVEESENTHSQKQKPKKASLKQQKENTNCLACNKKCTGSQASVLCQLCSLWCHKECANLSTAVFKSLALQVKEVGTAYWACKSCLSFAAKTNLLLKNMNTQLTAMDSKITQNVVDIQTNKKNIEKMDSGLKKVERSVENVKKQVEEEMFEEMRERESRRLNVVVHGLEEQDGTGEGRERAEKDKEECGKIFASIEAGVRRDQIKFCRRIGERSRDPRPLIVGLTSEDTKRRLLDRARNLQNSRYENMNIVADLTRRQRQEEVKMREDAEKRNRNLTEEDRSKNLKWMVVGRKGEKRLIKGIDREYQERNRDRNRGFQQNRNRDEIEDRRRQDTGARRKERGGWSQPMDPQYRRETRDPRRGFEEEPDRQNQTYGERRESQYTNNRRDRERRYTPPPLIRRPSPGRPEETITSKRGRGPTPDSDQEACPPLAKNTRQ